MIRLACWTTVLFVGLGVLSAQAGVVFYDNDLAGFNTAVAAYTHIGTEDFEESTLTNGSSASFAGPLTQLSTTSPYPTSILQPIEVSVNGPGLLAAFKNSVIGQTTVVMANSGNDTLDWNFETADNIIAVGLNPVTYTGSNVTRDNTITVYDTDGGLLGSAIVDSNDAGTNHVGILATGSSRIGRVNFEGADSISEGGDNAALYSQPVPEPSTWLLATGGLLSLGALVRRLH